MPTLTQTTIFAAQCHEGQRDKAGADYILHPLRVMGLLGHNATLEAQQAALLHDVVEDCGVTFEQLTDRGYSATVVEAIRHLTKTEEEEKAPDGYEQFIERCARHPLATQVKIADLRDNMDLSRFGPEHKPSDKEKRRLEKYQKALDRLSQCPSRPR